jgi:hypothetical protein
MAETTGSGGPGTAAEPPAAATPSIADPAPLGLAGFALTTFVLSCINANIVGVGTQSIVIGLALFYGGVVQLLAGMWEFKNRNTFGALAFSSYGGFWLSFAAILIFYKPTGNPADAETAIGLYLLAWAIFTCYMIVPSLRVSGAVAGVFVFLTATFILLAIGALNPSENATKIGGYLGIATAAIAWYASFAGVTNATWKRVVLPTWPAGTR